MRVHNPLNEDSYTQYDHSFSTDGEQVAVRFRSDLNAAEVEYEQREKGRKFHHRKKPTKKELLFAASAKGSAQQAGLSTIMDQHPDDSFEDLVKKTVIPFIQRRLDTAAAAAVSEAAASAAADAAAAAAAADPNNAAIDAIASAIAADAEAEDAEHAAELLTAIANASATAANFHRHDFLPVNLIAADPGEVDILSLSVVKVEGHEDAAPHNLLDKINQVIDHPETSSFKFPTKEYKRESHFQESNARYDRDLSGPQCRALRAYFRTGSSPRVAESTSYNQHIVDLMNVFDSLCRLHLHRNRVAGRFKSQRKHQSALDNIANDIMRGQNTMNWPRGMEKPPRQNTVLGHGLSLQTRAIKHHQNVPHHRLLRVLYRRRSRNEPVLLVFFVREAGSSKYCCACSAELAHMDANRMRACTNDACPIYINKIDRDRSASIILLRFLVWAVFDIPRPPPFNGGSGDQLGDEDIA